MHTTWLAVITAALTAFTATKPPSPAAHRLRALRAPPAADDDSSPVRDARLRVGAALAAWLTAFVLLGGTAGAVVGTGIAVLVHRSLRRAASSADRHRTARLARDLPLALDLLVACLRAGTTWNDALDAVAAATDGPLGDELRAASARTRLGAPPAEAWGPGTTHPTLAPLARTLTRATDSGAPLAPSLTRLASDQRRDTRAQALKQARTAGIRALLPLGICFLPAFFILGLLPILARTASEVLNTW